jgi:O-acetyl-ADP-ribose deacetylase
MVPSITTPRAVRQWSGSCSREAPSVFNTIIIIVVCGFLLGGYSMQVEVVIGDIAKQADMEAVVNSANPNLRMGSGVAGAIHMAAGPELEDYCAALAPLGLGKAVITPGFQLPNRWVIHAVAASFLNHPNPEQVLAQAIDAALRVATEHGIRTLAMPAIGTGVFRCPPKLSADYTAKALAWHAGHGSSLQHVRICVMSEAMKASFERALAQAFAANGGCWSAHQLGTAAGTLMHDPAGHAASPGNAPRAGSRPCASRPAACGTAASADGHRR